MQARGFKMNKAEFVADVAERMSDSKQKAEEAVNAVFEAITAALKRGDESACRASACST